MDQIEQRAMLLARQLHAGQFRNGNGKVPYTAHLAEVAGLVASVLPGDGVAIAAAWMHDSIEDQGVDVQFVADKLGWGVSNLVHGLTDYRDTSKTRATRLIETAERLGGSPPRVQTIKCADIVSNLTGIEHSTFEKGFIHMYAREKLFCLDEMKRANPTLYAMARDLAEKLV